MGTTILRRSVLKPFVHIDRPIPPKILVELVLAQQYAFVLHLQRNPNLPSHICTDNGSTPTILTTDLIRLFNNLKINCFTQSQIS